MEEKNNILDRLLKFLTKQDDLNVSSKQGELDYAPKKGGLDDLLLMSEHGDGYVRENAVRQLGMLGNPISVQKLMVRLNDWVPQVRNAAREALFTLMIADNAKAFAVNLPRLYHLRTCGRDKHDKFIGDVIEFLLKVETLIV